MFNFVDSSIIGVKSLSTAGVLNEWSTHSLSAILNGASVEATYVISTELLDQPSTYSGEFVDVILQYSQHTETQSQSITNALIETFSVMSLVNNSEFTIGNDLNQQVMISLSPNEAPIASVNAPYSGQRFMESTPIEVMYTVSDDDDADQLLLARLEVGEDDFTTTMTYAASTWLNGTVSAPMSTGERGLASLPSVKHPTSQVSQV